MRPRLLVWEPWVMNTDTAGGWRPPTSELLGTYGELASWSDRYPVRRRAVDRRTKCTQGAGPGMQADSLAPLRDTSTAVSFAVAAPGLTGGFLLARRAGRRELAAHCSPRPGYSSHFLSGMPCRAWPRAGRGNPRARPTAPVSSIVTRKTR